MCWISVWCFIQTWFAHSEHRPHVVTVVGNCTPYSFTGLGRVCWLAFFSTWRLRASTTPTLPLRANRWLRTNLASIWALEKIYGISKCWRWNWTAQYVHPGSTRGPYGSAAWCRCDGPCGLFEERGVAQQIKLVEVWAQPGQRSGTGTIFRRKLTLVVVGVILWLGHCSCL